MNFVVEGRPYYANTDYVPAPERGYRVLRETFASAADAEAWIRAQHGAACRDAENDLGTWVRIVDESHSSADPADADIVARHAHESTECPHREDVYSIGYRRAVRTDCGDCARCRASKLAYPYTAGVLTVREQMARRAEYWRAVERFQSEASHV